MKLYSCAPLPDSWMLGWSPPPIPILRTSLQHLLSFIHNKILEGNETNKSIIVWFWGSGPNLSFWSWCWWRWSWRRAQEKYSINCNWSKLERLWRSCSTPLCRTFPSSCRRSRLFGKCKYHTFTQKKFSQSVVIFYLSRRKKSSKKMLKCVKMAVIQMAKRFNVTKQEVAL